MDYATCTLLVRTLLENRQWQLIDLPTLAAQVWEQWQSGERAQKPAGFVRAAVFQQYGVVLHDCLRAADTPCHERAWHELRAWMEQQIGRFTTDPADHDTLVSLAHESLHTRLLRGPLDHPRTLWAYVTTTLHRKCIDLARSRKHESAEIPLDPTTEIPMAAPDPSPESAVSHHAAREALRDFFLRYTGSPLQAQVAWLSFVHHLEPREIAAELHKPPHEIRLLKARAVEALRRLDPVALHELRELMQELA